MVINIMKDLFKTTYNSGQLKSFYLEDLNIISIFLESTKDPIAIRQQENILKHDIPIPKMWDKSALVIQWIIYFCHHLLGIVTNCYWS